MAPPAWDMQEEQCGCCCCPWVPLTPDSDGSQFLARMTEVFELYWATGPEGSLCENIDERVIV